MSYEYMQGFGAFGAAGQQQGGGGRQQPGGQQGSRGPRKPTSEEMEKFRTACASTDCSDKKRMRIIGGQIRDADARVAHFENQGCSVCSRDEDIYLCCPEDTEPYSPGAASQSPSGPAFPEDEITPSTFPGDEAAFDPSLVDPSMMTLEPIEETGGFPWGGVIIGLLLLGGAGFAGYWFLLRDKDEEEDTAGDDAADEE